MLIIFRSRTAAMRTVAIAAMLVVFAGASSLALAQAPTPVAGRDYIEISNGRPLDPADGVVVVEEYFNYICPGCNAFEPVFAPWAARLPSGVKLVHVPARFRADFVQYARAYYAAQSLNVAEKAHAAVYEAIHRTRTLPAEGQRPDEEKIAAFYADYGVDAQQFLAAMRSFAVDLKVRRAADHMQRIRIPSTPSVVINGRYLVQGQTYGDTLRIADYLIEKEKELTAAASGG
jgi:thiol:disulfide interchange protein DsbA